MSIINCKRSVRLNNGRSMPVVGFGTSQHFYANKIDDIGVCVEQALQAGYRHIDAAYWYRNEESIGKGIRKWMAEAGKKREDVFVVTKLPAFGMIKGGAKRYLEQSLKNLGLSYIDLYLIHVPFGLVEKNGTMWPEKDKEGNYVDDEGTDIIAMWKEMEHLVDAGLAKSIGVSNFNLKQLKKVCAIAKIPPAVIQIELHIYNQQEAMREFCKKKNIIITAHSPLGGAGRQPIEVREKNLPILLDDPVVKLIATYRGRDPAQILIRFLIQLGVTCIPKSINQDRIRSNINVFDFELSDTEMKALKALDKGILVVSFKLLPGMAEHPECPHT